MTPHGILLIDKPRGLTSHDVVARVRRCLGTRRVGHAGTLDPAAEGLLIVAVGAATRLIDRLQGLDKAYVAHVVLGVETDSADVEGAITDTHPDIVPQRASIERALDAMTGTIEQAPPALSAIKVAGQASHRRARRGEAVDLPARPVTIHRIELLSYRYPDLLMSVECGKGVYIRSLARDLGRVLGTGAYLHALLRTRIGDFDLSRSWSMDEVDRFLRPESWTLYGLHPDTALINDTAIVLSPARIEAWYHGRPIAAASEAFARSTPSVRAYSAEGEWVGLAQAEVGARCWQPRQVIPRTG